MHPFVLVPPPGMQQRGRPPVFVFREEEKNGGGIQVDRGDEKGRLTTTTRDLSRECVRSRGGARRDIRGFQAREQKQVLYRNSFYRMVSSLYIYRTPIERLKLDICLSLFIDAYFEFRLMNKVFFK